jgi:hypothetical protein
LTPRVSERDFAEVTVELEVGGTVLVRDQAASATEDKTLPMSVSAKLVYDEHRTAPTAGTIPTRSVRYYKEAGATLKIENTGRTPQLAEDHRLVVAENPGGRLSFAAANSLLNREELDLIDVTGDSLALDSLLPQRKVGANENWPADPNTMAAILSMDSVAAAEVQCTLDKFNHDFALVRLAGAVVGTADGSATDIEVRGVYLFDRKLRRITRFNLAVKEKRSIGSATPGLDGVAKLRVNLKPLESSPHLLPATLVSLRSKRRRNRATGCSTIAAGSSRSKAASRPSCGSSTGATCSLSARSPACRPRAPVAKRPSKNSSATSASRSKIISASWSPAANGPIPTATTAWKSSSAALRKKCRSNGTTTSSPRNPATACRWPSRSRAKW